jgi:hypothetical protein
MPHSTPVKIESYPLGPEGIDRSIRQIAHFARQARLEGELDGKSVRGWAAGKLKAVGIDGRSRTGTIRERTQCLLDAVRAQTIYVPDPVGAEWIQAPHVTLCLRDLCIPAEDCDGLMATLMGAMMSIGDSCWIVKQEFGAGKQPHVLVGFRDEHDQKLYADCANTNAPVYAGSKAMSEVWIDPMDEVSTSLGTSGAELVTLGAAQRDNEPGERESVTDVVARVFDRRMQHGLGSIEVLPGTGLGVIHGLGRGGASGGAHGHGGGPRGLRPAHARSATRPSSSRGALTHRRFSKGRWWGWYPEYGWILITADVTCATWGAPIVAPPALEAEANRQIQASGGDPVAVTWTDGQTYLFTQPVGGGALVQPCAAVGVAGAAPSHAAPRAVGAGYSVPSPTLIKQQMVLCSATWESMKGNVEACHNPNPGTCPPGYTMQPGGTGCILEATSANVGPNAGTPGTTPAATTLALGTPAIDDPTYAAWYKDYGAWTAFYDANQGIDQGQINIAGGLFSLYDILNQTYAYQTLAYEWQKKLNTICPLSSPILDPKTTQDTGLLQSLAQGLTTGSVATLASTTERIVVGALVVGAVGAGLYFSWPWLMKLRHKEAA